jgi:hypothetical protein
MKAALRAALHQAHKAPGGITRQLIAALSLVGLAAVTGGCVTATVQQVREARTGMNEGDSVVVLGRRNGPSSDETELKFIDCVSKNLSKGNNAIQVINEEQFRDALFPWFEPRTAPRNTKDLPELMSTPALARRLGELGLRYLVWIDGHTVRTESGGSMTCSVTTAGAGCFGFLSWENDSSYEASVWDVRNGNAVGRVSTDAVGTSYMPAIVVPLPLIARVQNSACTSLANQLKSFVTNG